MACAFLGGGSTAGLGTFETPGVSDCTRRISLLSNDCGHERCSNDCIGQSDVLLGHWDKCTSSEHNAIISAYQQHVWQCFDGADNPYICSHMTLFSRACTAELDRTFGAVALERGSEQCEHVQDGCTGGDLDETTDDEYLVKFPMMLERDKCGPVLASEGATGFLDAYESNCSDAALCRSELLQVQTQCAQPADAAAAGNLSCGDACRRAIDGLFSSADGGASWALCQGVAVPRSPEYLALSSHVEFDGRFYDGGNGGGGGGEWSTFGREAVSLYDAYHFKGTGCGEAEYSTGHSTGAACAHEHNASSLFITTVLLLLVAAAAGHVALARADAAGPLSGLGSLRLWAQHDATVAADGREEAARRFHRASTACALLSLLVLFSAWAGVWLPVGVVGGVTGLVAAAISRQNLPNLLRPLGSDGAAPVDCCGDVGGGDRTRWLEPVSSLHLTTAVLCGVGAFINFLFALAFVAAGHVADNGVCNECAATATAERQIFCTFDTCADQCGCDYSDYDCCRSVACSEGGGSSAAAFNAAVFAFAALTVGLAYGSHGGTACGGLCQIGALAHVSVFALLLLMTLSVAASRTTAALRVAWRVPTGHDAAFGLGAAIPAVVVQAEPMGFGIAQPAGQEALPLGTPQGTPVAVAAAVSAMPATAGLPVAAPAQLVG